MSNRIVILSGSPRADGSTERLVRACAAGAEAAGKTVTAFRVADLQIAPCKGCGYCHAHGGECVRHDDMPRILDALKSADALVFASPIYYWSITAQLKTAIDRLYATLRTPSSVKTAAVILTCGNADADAAFGPAIAMFRQIFRFLQWEDGGAVLAKSLHAAEQLDGRDEPQLARALGERI